MKILLLVFFLLVNQHSFALNTIELSIEQFLFDISSDKNQTRKNIQTFQLDKINMELDLSSEPMALNLNLEKVSFPEPYHRLSSLKLSCIDFSIETFADESSINCHKGEILANPSFLKNLNTKNKYPKNSLIPIATFSFHYNLDNQNLIFSINDLTVSDNSFISLAFKQGNEQWDLDLKFNNVDYNDIKNYVDFYLKDTIAELEDISAQINLKAFLTGSINNTQKNLENSYHIDSANIIADIKKLNYVDNDNLAENLAFSFILDLEEKNSSTQKKSEKSKISLVLKKITGELIQNEIYVKFNAKEKIKLKIIIPDDNSNEILLSELDFFIPDVLHLKSSGELSLNSVHLLKTLKADLQIIDYEQVNQLYLKDILEGSDYEGFNIQGNSKHTINVISNKNSQHIEMKSVLSSVNISFIEQFSFSGLNGLIHWDNNAIKKTAYKQNYLSWDKARLSHLPLGKTYINFISQGNNISLSEATLIPIFDGGLQIDQFTIKESQPSDKQTDKKMTMTFNGLIKPISLNLISQQFNWPVLDGKLSAIIPTTSYSEDQFKIGGAMMLQVFDGFIILKDLKIENPIQDYARLEANIDLRNLNLQSLTNTYDFGEIHGRIDGSMSELILESWKPLQFNASIQTPEKDKSKHRISQRAIDNLSSLGGVSGLLSKSFLRFFESFGYDKIGLSCRLKNNICIMAGVEKKGAGYYIVKGGGIPRIDVVGFQNKVNWEVLLNRLKAIQYANQAVIE